MCALPNITQRSSSQHASIKSTGMQIHAWIRLTVDILLSEFHTLTHIYSLSSTERTGKAFMCLMVDCFTKAAEFVPIPDIGADTVARDVHDYWFMRHAEMVDRRQWD